MTPSDTTDNNFASSELTDQITTFSTSVANNLDTLSSLKSDLNNLQTNSCLSGSSSEPCDFSELNTQIDSANSNIDTILADGPTLTQNLLKNNNLINASLAQINSNYLLNSRVSGKTLDNLTQQNRQLKQEVNNKRRMTEINNYYSNMNTYLNIVMRNLVIILAVLIFFTVLSKKGILPGNISTMVTVICVLGIIGYVIYTIYDINIRDRFNFSEYVIPFDLTAKRLEPSGNETGFTDIRKVLGNELMGGINQLQGLTDTCIGNACCSTGTIYDVTRGSCILECSGGKVYTETINPSTGKPVASCTSPSN